jgi:probable phosphoglycerate mutase
MTSRLILVRHGETDWNAAGRAQGHTDIPLNATGEDQARRLAKRLAGEQIDRILSSDLARCLRTVSLALPGREVEALTALRERSFGELEGQPYSLARDAAHRLAAELGVEEEHVRAGGGESYRDLWERLEPVAERLLASEGTTLVATHGGAKAMLIAMLLGGSPLMAKRFRLSNASVSEFILRDGLWLLTRYQDVRHLDDAP